MNQTLYLLIFLISDLLKLNSLAARDLEADASAVGGSGGGSRGRPGGGTAGTRRSLKDWEIPSRPSLVPAEKDDRASFIDGRDISRSRVVSWNKGRSVCGPGAPDRSSSSRVRVVGLKEVRWEPVHFEEEAVVSGYTTGSSRIKNNDNNQHLLLVVRANHDFVHKYL